MLVLIKGAGDLATGAAVRLYRAGIPVVMTEVARVAGRTACAQLTGVVRGMLPAGLAVTAGMKAGDIDPRCRAEHCFTVRSGGGHFGGAAL